PHNNHVAHERTEQASDRADGLDHEQRPNAWPHLATEESREDAREFNGGDGAVRSEVDPASDRAGVVDGHREAPGDIVGVDVRPPDSGRPKGHHSTLLEPPEEESHDANSEERAGAQGHERDEAQLKIVHDEFILPEFEDMT